jgi:hypothetical protein
MLMIPSDSCSTELTDSKYIETRDAAPILVASTAPSQSAALMLRNVPAAAGKVSVVLPSLLMLFILREGPTPLTLSVQEGVVTAPIKLILPSDACPAPHSAIAIVALVQSMHCLIKVLSGSVQTSSYADSIS